MKIDTRTDGRFLVVKLLEERMGADRALAFKTAMNEYMEAGHRCFVLDLSEITFIDSAGLGAMLALLKRVGKGGEILVVGASEAVAGMFKLTRMDRVFPMFGTVERAIAGRP